MSIDAQQLTKRFGRTLAVDGATFRAEAGERVALVGRNGAGKSTLLRMLATFLPPTSGAATVSGFDVFSQSNAVREIVGYLPEGSPIEPEMGVVEYLRFRGRLRGLFGSILRRHFNDAVEICGLGEHRATVIGRLSRGVRARVALADAILHRPPVLLLDDPLASVDAAQRQTFLAALRNSAEERALLFATHTPDDASRLFTRVLLLDRGRLVLDAPLDPAHPPVSLGATVTGWLLDLAS